MIKGLSFNAREGLGSISTVDTWHSFQPGATFRVSMPVRAWVRFPPQCGVRRTLPHELFLFQCP